MPEVPKKCPPWPRDPLCASCGKPVTVTCLQRTPNRTYGRLVHHQDGSAPCEFTADSVFVQGDIPPFRSVGFGLSILTFPSLDEAVKWAKLWAQNGYTVYLGYVLDHRGDRRIGHLNAEAGALAVVAPGEDGPVVSHV